MIAKLSDSKVTMLAWLPVPPFGPCPPESPCLFSDGVQFWAGRWGGDHILVNANLGHVLVNVGDALRAHLRWAKLNNLVRVFEREPA